MICVWTLDPAQTTDGGIPQCHVAPQSPPLPQEPGGTVRHPAGGPRQRPHERRHKLQLSVLSDRWHIFIRQKTQISYGKHSRWGWWPSTKSCQSISLAPEHILKCSDFWRVSAHSGGSSTIRWMIPPPSPTVVPHRGSEKISYFPLVLCQRSLVTESCFLLVCRRPP